MQLSQNFTYEEAILSRTAVELGIDNTPDKTMLIALIKTAAFMEDVRRVLGNKSIIVTSWYRCYELEAAITKQSILKVRNGTGHHPLGGAVDFVCPKFGTPYEICTKLAPLVDSLGIGQLIYEYGRWVHISRLPVRSINRVLTIDRQGLYVGITSDIVT